MKTSIKILLAIIIVLIAFRIYLPHLVTDYINKVLQEVPEYTGSIEGVELDLYRGAYKIKGLKMEHEESEMPVPFLDIETIDLSVQWNALFNGKVVGEVDLFRPSLNFVVAVADTAAAEQTGAEADWTKPLKDLMPLQINKFTVVEGTITYRDYTAKPQVNLKFDSVQLVAKNLNNVVNENEKLPSTIDATATSIGQGKLTLIAQANLLKQIPDFDMNASYENVSLPALNNFTKAYAKLDFEKGLFNVYTEMALADGIITGYVKPVLKEIKLVEVSKDKKNPLEMAWESVTGTIMEFFENQPKDQFATKVPFRGDVNNVETSIWMAIGNILKNAFVDAFEGKVDSSVSFDDIKEGATEKEKK